MTGQGQGLLKRHVKYTREEFSEHWLNHASKVTPWALENGVIYYAQVHNPRLAPDVSPPDDLDISEWDGAAEMVIQLPADWKPTAKSEDYYLKVILPDERRFLLNEAKMHIRRVGGGTVVGDKVVIIDGGKPLINCGGDMKVWDEWKVVVNE